MRFKKGLGSLWVKLLAALMTVAAVAIGVVAVAANRSTVQQFQLYVSQGRQLRAERLAPQVAAYYARTGSWSAVDDWLGSLDQNLGASEEGTASGAHAGGQGQGLGLGRGWGSAAGASADRLVLADADGQVLADSSGDLAGSFLPKAELDKGVPVEVDGKLVGTLLIPAEAIVHEAPEAEFLRQVNRTLLWAGLAAGLIALLLGLLLARQLTAPLRALTQATQRLAQGGLTRFADNTVPQVTIRSQDEIGELGRSFNRMADSLARQQTLRRNLMADIAHELRTPLSVMRSDLEALLDGVYEPTPESLASLQEETLLLQRLVDDLRSLAQAEADQLKLERQPTDLADLLLGVVSSFRLLAESHGQNLELELPSAALIVDADPHRVRQVVANLVSNALRHGRIPGGSVLVSAGLEPAHGADQAWVSVTDDGPGIAADELPHLFDRFWRGGTARADGSGLGLAIARELVRAHGGQIRVKSHPEDGTTFHFSLPLEAQ